MQTVTVGEVQKNFGKILRHISAGEEIVIAKRGKPVARLTALGPKTDIDWPDFLGEAIEAGGKSASDTVMEGREERL